MQKKKWVRQVETCLTHSWKFKNKAFSRLNLLNNTSRLTSLFVIIHVNWRIPPQDHLPVSPPRTYPIGNRPQLSPSPVILFTNSKGALNITLTGAACCHPSLLSYIIKNESSHTNHTNLVHKEIGILAQCPNDSNKEGALYCGMNIYNPFCSSHQIYSVPKIISVLTIQPLFETHIGKCF